MSPLAPDRSELPVSSARGAAAASSRLPQRVLVLDDQPMTIRILTRILEEADCDVIAAESAAEAYAKLEQFTPSIAIVDVYLNDGDGLDFVRSLRGRARDVGILVISSEDTETLAAQAVSSGADDFLSKPIAPGALRVKVKMLSELRERRVRMGSMESQLNDRARHDAFQPIVSHSDAMRAIFRQVEKVARRDLGVLVFGESGTGKELVARSIHAISPRAQGPFIELNCAALPPSLVESELFGHEKGAFTGAIATRAGKLELAHGGTLFLDEIGELPLDIQPKLLRALQEKQVTRVGGHQTVACDFRLVSATHRDLAGDVQLGRFREDLFYRIAVFPLQLPPLRDRMEDLDLLLDHFLREEGREPDVTPEAKRLLREYPWPGNVRELKNFSQAIAVLSESRIEAEHVRQYFGARLDRWGTSGGTTMRGLPPGSPKRPVRPLAQIEKEEVLHALLVLEGNVQEAARLLGMGRATLYKYIKREGIDLANLEAAIAVVQLSGAGGGGLAGSPAG
jgi:DNA-binding NtrC family response regulator